MGTVLYRDTYKFFGWPSRAQAFSPKGAGARICAEEVRRKIASELRRQFPGVAVEIGILAADPNSDSTEAPIAIVCEFPSGATEEALERAHQLAWNFSRAALLITLEPHRLLAWSCWLDPEKDKSPQVQELSELPKGPGATLDALQSSARDLLHWVSLITGNYLKQQPKKFRSEGRADTLLLENLRVVRRELLSLGLGRTYCHDLLARIIFAQFLFHRKDSDGRPFLDSNLLKGRCEGELKHVHEGLDTILADGDETYRFFRWLDRRFNGDLFPGKEDQTDAERVEAWRQEKEAVTENPAVLKLLADFVSGQLQLKDRQLTLWRQYSFDVIPLEFISSVYEEFLTEDKHKTKAYYTPSHLVDFVLDGVLPWNDDDYDLRILDPCCGSGIFLVKAFQRLIHRWRRVNKREPLVSDLKPLLANNLWGIDRDPEAVRVACFSLYLAMADAIEPKYYLKREKVFPRLRGLRLLDCDFFDEEVPGIKTPEASDNEEAKFDLVIGNAPWGDKSIKDTSDVSLPPAAETTRKPRKTKAAPPTKAEVWARTHGWPVANNDIGPLFLTKGAALVGEGGSVAMIQPASTLLYQRAGKAVRLRQKLFATFTVDEITNLSAIRRYVFAGAIGPACIIVFRKERPDPSRVIHYFYPRPLRNAQGSDRLLIEPQNVNQITHHEAANEPLVWSVLAIGGRRDMAVIQRLGACDTLKKLRTQGKIVSRLGVIPGDQRKKLPDLKGKHYFDAKKFPDNVFLQLNADALPKWDDPCVASTDSTDFEAFKQPQLLIKQSFLVTPGRFRAALVRSNDQEWGTICKKTYLSVHDRNPNASNLRAACLAYNSCLATYYLTLTSSRIGHYITETLTDELLQMPLPPAGDYDIEAIKSFEDIDRLTRDLYHLNEAEWALVEDLLALTLPAILRTSEGPGEAQTERVSKKPDEESEPAVYANVFARVLQTTFGKDKAVCSTVFREPDGDYLPVRLAAIHLDWPGRRSLTIEPMDKNGLFEKLQHLYQDALSAKSRALSGDGLGFQRVAFLFHSHIEDGHRIPSLYIIKPDQRRYWTRSLAMRDADQLAGAILRAAGRGRTKA
jgi:Eco57I restriction-modification methylase